MGCCLSTLEPNKAKPSSLDDNKTHQFSCESKSPPRPEEETVKEVLSETPKPKPKLQLELELEPETEVAKVDEEPKKPNITVSPKKATLEKKVQSLEKKLPSLEKRQHYNPEPSTPEEISEVSEICSLSETISNTTLEDQQQQWGVKDSATSRVCRSQGHSGNLMYHNNGYNAGHNHGHQNPNVQLRRNHGRSPVRPGRANPSPPRRPGPGQGPGRVGENSARRSRSPVTRGNVSRSPSAKRGGPSPGRVRMVNGPGHGPESVRKADEENEREDGGPKESLENPLVSLECFIFL